MVHHPNYSAIGMFLDMEGHSPIELKDEENPVRKYQEMNCDGAIIDINDDYKVAEDLCRLDESVVITTSNSILNKNLGTYANRSKRIRANGHIVRITSIIDIIKAIEKAKK